MPYDIQWLLEGRIIHMRDYGECTIEELDKSIIHLHKLLDEGSVPVHLIHDNRDVTKYPLSIQSLKPIVKKHANTGWLMFVSDDKATRFISTVLSSVAGQKAKHCSHLDEAIIILQKQDPSLPKDFAITLRNIRVD